MSLTENPNSSQAAGKTKGRPRSAPDSLSRAISPPAKKGRVNIEDDTVNRSSGDAGSSNPTTRVIKSPFQLTAIHDLRKEANIDTVTLEDILGDPLISECWEFNYLHDIAFLRSYFDPDVRDTVQIHVVHGFWKSDDPNRRVLTEEAAKYGNVKLHTGYLSEFFGTHHTKMIILFRHDDTAEVVIHTANMIVKDWRNMTQAVWRSPRLPLLKARNDPEPKDLKIGSGEKFKYDLLNYLRVYDEHHEVLAPLSNKLGNYNFAAVRGALIASVPGRHQLKSESGTRLGWTAMSQLKSDTRWGWTAMWQALHEIPVQQEESEVVIQVSSIATLGKDEWLKNTLFSTLSESKGSGGKKPKFKVVFPTPDEIRRSLDGYSAGGSIHTKIQSKQQANQLEYMRPFLHHWANDAEHGADLPKDREVLDAGRNRAAPHIKTYIRYGKDSIDWALLTSANMSKQAWGEPPGKVSDLVRICSYEIGVLVWPALYGDDAVMKPAFKKDDPDVDNSTQDRTVVGLRMPYSLPLQRYGPSEKPWVPTMSYVEKDWKGQAWRVNEKNF